MDKVEQGIVISAAGWIAAGAICIYVYALLKSASELYLGIFVITVGILLIASRKRIEGLRDEMIRKQAIKAKAK